MMFKLILHICIYRLYNYFNVDDLQCYAIQVSGIRQQSSQTEEVDLTLTKTLLMSMAGVLSTKGVTMGIPTVGRKIFGPHVGCHFKKVFHGIKLPGIYKRKKDDKSTRKMSSNSAKESRHDPG